MNLQTYQAVATVGNEAWLQIILQLIPYLAVSTVVTAFLGWFLKDKKKDRIDKWVAQQESLDKLSLKSEESSLNYVRYKYIEMLLSQDIANRFLPVPRGRKWVTLSFVWVLSFLVFFVTHEIASGYDLEGRSDLYAISGVYFIEAVAIASMLISWGDYFISKKEKNYKLMMGIVSVRREDEVDGIGKGIDGIISEAVSGKYEPNDSVLRLLVESLYIRIFCSAVLPLILFFYIYGAYDFYKEGNFSKYIGDVIFIYALESVITFFMLKYVERFMLKKYQERFAA